jgi:hypothetical protein
MIKMASKGWKQRKHKRTSVNGKTFDAGSTKKYRIPSLMITKNLTTAESLMKLDDFAWRHLGFSSASEIDKDIKKKIQYQKIIDSYAGDINYNTAYELENENYHLLLEALIATGHAKPFTTQYHALKYLQEQYHRAAEVADTQRLRFLWARIKPVLKLFIKNVDEIDEADVLHSDMIFAARNKNYDSIEKIYDRMDGSVFLT